jgi:hypothetical protein
MINLDEVYLQSKFQVSPSIRDWAKNRQSFSFDKVPGATYESYGKLKNT